MDMLWNTLQLFCSCHIHATNTDRLTNYGTTHLPCKWYCQGYLCHPPPSTPPLNLPPLSSLSWYQCLQMQASCLTDYYYCTGREPWMEILESGPWENSNGKAYATVVLTITSAKTRNLFRLPVQVNCLRAWLKEWKKINGISILMEWTTDLCGHPLNINMNSNLWVHKGRLNLNGSFYFLFFLPVLCLYHT